VKKTLLIVDDEPGVRMLLEHYFSEDYNVISKEDGDEAIEWLKQGNEPQLILTDIEMPRVSGLELVKRVRNELNKPNLPCLLVTGKSKEDYYLSSFRIGANGFISKPFSAETVKKEVEYHLAH
jgi:CheY-like chemotaxis protein